MNRRRPHVILRTLLPLGLVSLSLALVSLPVAASATTKINYLALGDSYSSGEGLAAQASGYISDPYITGSDGCHRASDAYPELVKRSLGSNLGSFKFEACSGAYSGETMPVNKTFDKGGSMVSGRDYEPPQLSTTYLKSSVNDISLTIGGNDAGFSNVATSCTSVMLKVGPVQKVIGLPPVMTGGSCASMVAQSKKVIGNGTVKSELGTGLVKTYETILNNATKARLAVLTYPQMLVPKQIPAKNFCPLTSEGLVKSTVIYAGFNSKVQGEINAMEYGVNKDIASAVAAVGSDPKYQGRIRLVNVTTATTPYAQPCNTKTMNRSDINGIKFAPGDGFAQLVRCISRSNFGATCNNFIATESLHPTRAGHQRMANALENAFKANWGPSSTTPIGAAASSIVNGIDSYCAVIASGRVDCWGDGSSGQLGDGQFYTSGNQGSAVPVGVVNTSGSGYLGGVKSLASNGPDYGFCALLTSGRVDCWGSGYRGELGDGQLYASGNFGSAVPVGVVNTSGSGPLGGVASLASLAAFNVWGPGGSYCAVLTSGGVDCWGAGNWGQLGSGSPTGFFGSSVPVAVIDTSGSGNLGGVASLVSDSLGYCALLTSGGVDCWGYGFYGQLGDGQFYPIQVNQSSAVPVAVIDTSGSGNLGDVASLVGIGDGVAVGSYCALLTSGGVDCWGYGHYGALGDGQFYISGDQGSAVPVAVVNTSGSSNLGGVASLASDGNGYCALRASGGVDCWGDGYYGELGDGQFDTSGNSGSAVPVTVVNSSGSGSLVGVISLASTSGLGTEGSYCALLTSGGVDCWGLGGNGQLGDGQFYNAITGSAVPVSVAFPSS